MIAVVVELLTVHVVEPAITKPSLAVVLLSPRSMVLALIPPIVVTELRSGPLTTAQTVLLPVVVLIVMPATLLSASTYALRAPVESKTNT